jgi:large subunit ribosomal protein L22
MTEKNYNPEQRNAKAMNKQMKVSKAPVESPIKKEKILETEKPEDKVTEEKSEEVKTEKAEDQKTETKKPEKPKEKKSEAVVRTDSLPVSTKHSVAICKFIKNKKIEKAMEDLQRVIRKKMAVPMKGEIPHRKGNIMSGRYPKNAAEGFIKLLKTLRANANVNGLENAVIVEAIANFAQRPVGKGGRARKKRTHVKLVAREKLNSGDKKK